MDPVRNMLLVDGAYMSRVSKDNFNGQLDMLKLKKALEQKFGKISRAFWFTPYNTESNASFHAWLQKYVKLEVVLFTKKPYKCRHCDNEHDVERGLDVGLVVKAIELQKSYDRLILCNGDGDLGDGLRYLRDGLAKQIVIVGTGETISSVTSLHADEVFDVSAADVSPSLYKD